MNQFHVQAVQNKKFLDCIEAQFENFNDWKITVCFYIAIHLLKALAKERNKEIGQTHYEIESNLDPNRTRSPVMQMPPNIWKTYKKIFRYSISSRYQGIENFDDAQLAMK